MTSSGLSYHTSYGGLRSGFAMATRMSLKNALEIYYVKVRVESKP